MAQYINKPSYSLTLPKDPVVFFGTGLVSLKSLEHIAKSYEIEAVVTLTDRRSSGGHKVPSLVKQWGLEHRVKVVEVDSKKGLLKAFETNSFISRLGIVIDFGIILPGPILDYFQRGIINSHFSLLPKWRGPDPITFALLSGEKQTGISIMQVDEGLDTGDIVTEAQLTIDSSDTATSLTDKLIELSNQTLDKFMPQIISGSSQAEAQTGIATYTRKLLKSDGKLDWTKPADQLEREIRAYSGWPNSYTIIDDQEVTVAKASIKNYTTKKTGVFVLTKNKKLAVTCKDSLLIIENIKPAGKKQMDSASFLAGRQKFRSSLKIIN